MRVRPAVPLLALAVGVAPLAGQTVADGMADDQLDRWMIAWSPFAPIANHLNAGPAADRFSDPLVTPPPRVGLFWTGGIAAGLPFERPDGRAALQALVGRSTGPYRRALDPGDATVVQASALSWEPIDTRGGVAGRFVADDERLTSAPYAASLLPYGSDPLVVTDTTAPPMRRVRARLEGAFGWRFGGWGLGAAAGLEVHDQRVGEARFLRSNRWAEPVIGVSVSRTLPVAGLRIGAYGRWADGRETIQLTPFTDPGLIYLLDGYNEPDPREISLAQAEGVFRRIERTARAFGGGIAGRMVGSDWAVRVERGTRHDRHSSERKADPASDTWDATGWLVDGAAQRPLGPHLTATVNLRYSTLDGDERRAELASVITLQGRERFLDLSAELRYRPAGSSWVVVGRYALAHMRLIREDFVATVGTDLVEWTTTAAVSAAHRFGHTSLGIGFAMAWYGAEGSIPNPDSLGPVYRQFVAPGLGLEASRALPVTGTLSVRRDFNRRTAVILVAGYETVGPRSTSAPFAPAGHRATWTASATVVLSAPRSGT